MAHMTKFSTGTGYAMFAFKDIVIMENNKGNLIVRFLSGDFVEIAGLTDEEMEVMFENFLEIKAMSA